MTPARKAAQLANARRSRGATTPQGQERIRRGRLRHGFYSQRADAPIEALGEDPHRLATLIAGAREHWRPRNTEEEQMIERLGCAMLQMERAENLAMHGRMRYDLGDSPDDFYGPPDGVPARLVLRAEGTASGEFLKIEETLLRLHRRPKMRKKAR